MQTVHDLEMTDFASHLFIACYRLSTDKRDHNGSSLAAQRRDGENYLRDANDRNLPDVRSYGQGN